MTNEYDNVVEANETYRDMSLKELWVYDIALDEGRYMEYVPAFDIGNNDNAMRCVTNRFVTKKRAEEAIDLISELHYEALLGEYGRLDVGPEGDKESRLKARNISIVIDWLRALVKNCDAELELIRQMRKMSKK